MQDTEPGSRFGIWFGPLMGVIALVAVGVGVVDIVRTGGREGWALAGFAALFVLNGWTTWLFAARALRSDEEDAAELAEKQARSQAPPED